MALLAVTLNLFFTELLVINFKEEEAGCQEEASQNPGGRGGPLVLQFWKTVPTGVFEKMTH